MSSAQALSSLATLAVSFSIIVFPRSACAETEPTDKTASKGNDPSVASNFTAILIELPLMTGSEPSSFVEVAARWLWRLRDTFRSILIEPRKA
jgi:hypothetical protein